MIIKSFTITLFIGLIVCFVAYRSGYLGNGVSIIPFNPNRSVIKSNKTDSLPVPAAINPAPTIMPSSKVMIMHEGLVGQTDSLKAKAISDSIKMRRLMMSSSKSGIILQPINIPDTLKMDNKKAPK